MTGPRFKFLCVLLAAVSAIGGTCGNGPAHYNNPPTVTITAGPTGLVYSASVTYSWQGEDADGNLSGFRYYIDDTLDGTLTESTWVEVAGIGIGAHDFGVRAVDDSGAQSAIEWRSFELRYDSLVTPRGNDSTFEIATWNIENFPKQGDQTVDKVGALMARLDLDLYALQEISDTLMFKELVRRLPGYAGQYSSDDYGSFYIKTGVVYKTDVVSVSDVTALFEHNGSVTRPPMKMTVTASHNGSVFDFKLIVMHLKAGGDPDDQEERRQTIRLLKGHIDGELVSGGEQDFIALGDWNDRLDDSRTYNVFLPFLDDSTNYTFLTRALVGDYQQVSYIGGSLIDHILVTADALEEYQGGTTTTLRLDDEVVDYRTVVSDHRPVMSVFPVFR